jgi:ComF family protein
VAFAGWQHAGKVFIEALFPGRCLQCGEWLLLDSDHSVPLCDDCRERLFLLNGARCKRCGIELISEKDTCLRCRTAEYSFDSNMSLFAYSGAAKCLLAALKFGGRRRLAAFFAARAADALRAYGLDEAAVVPAPPRPGRHVPDAVELVARALERHHGIDVFRLLRRAGVVQQKSLDYERRRDNLKGKLSLVRGGSKRVLRREVVLLDDVFTTGATLDACARVLRAAGCRSVRAVTLVIEE